MQQADWFLAAVACTPEDHQMPCKALTVPCLTLCRAVQPKFCGGLVEAIVLILTFAGALFATVLTAGYYVSTAGHNSAPGAQVQSSSECRGCPRKHTAAQAAPSCCSCSCPWQPGINAAYSMCSLLSLSSLPPDLQAEWARTTAGEPPESMGWVVSRAVRPQLHATAAQHHSPTAVLVHRIAQHGRGQERPYIPACPLLLAFASLGAAVGPVMCCS